MRILFALGILVLVSLSFLACEEQTPTELSNELKSGSVVEIQSVQRPISDFVDAQGTYCWPDGEGGCFLFVPPVENFMGWSDPAKGICSAFDYAGLADEWITEASGGDISFGTTTSGSITERPLPDGRAEVHIRLQTRNAMTFAVNACNDFSSDPLLFGHRAAEIFDGAEAALGNGLFHIKMIIPEPGAELPDLIQFLYTDELPGYELVMLSTYYHAAGPLGEASGYTDGTPGRLSCTQTGLFFTGGGGATADNFPAEQINIRAVGNVPRGPTSLDD